MDGLTAMALSHSKISNLVCVILVSGILWELAISGQICQSFLSACVLGDCLYMLVFLFV